MSRAALVEAMALALYRVNGDDPPWPLALPAAQVLYRRDATAVLTAMCEGPHFESMTARLVDAWFRMDAADALRHAILGGPDA